MQLIGKTKWSAAFLILCGLLAAGPAAAAGKACDRGCLEGLAGKYLEAMAAHDASRLPAAKPLRVVENDQPLRLGEGTWATITGLGKYRHIFSDPEAGQVAVITTITENNVPAIFDLWLKVENRKIVQVETQIIRDPVGAARYEALGAPEAVWLQSVPVADRISRDALVATADRYFKGMPRDDPKGDYSFFDPDCNRLEHAQQTTNVRTTQPYGHVADVDFASMGCQAQFQTGFLGFVTGIRDHRFLAVDEERQAAFAFSDLDHNGTVRVLHMSTGKDSVVPPYFNVPRTLQVGEAFRMRGSKIWRIEMTLTELPYGMRPAGAAPAPPPRPPAGKPVCDRDCLSDMLGQVLQAIADHNPANAPLAANVRYTENGQALTPGDGLWGTASSIAIPGDGLAALGPNISAYKLGFADVAAGEAGYLGAVNENGTPGILSLRIKVAGGKVTEIEAVIVRQEGNGPTGGTMTLMRPLLLAEFNAKGFGDPDPLFKAGGERVARKDLVAGVNHYWDGVEKSASVVAWLTPDCLRRDNGGQTTGNGAAGPIDPAVPTFRPFALGCAAQLDSGFFRYVSKVRDRRILAVDEDRGLVLAVAMIDHTGAVKTIAAGGGTVNLPSNLLTPSTDMVAAVFKMQTGKIARIEAIERPVPFGMTSGWTD